MEAHNLSTQDNKHRSHLPMPNSEKPTFIAYDTKEDEMALKAIMMRQ